MPNGAGVFPGETYTIDDEEDYSSLIEMVKRVIEKIPAIEVFFSVEFVYKEIESDRNLFGTIDNGIDSILALLEDLDKMLEDEKSNARETDWCRWFRLMHPLRLQLIGRLTRLQAK